MSPGARRTLPRRRRTSGLASLPALAVASTPATSGATKQKTLQKGTYSRESADSSSQEGEAFESSREEESLASVAAETTFHQRRTSPRKKAAPKKKKRASRAKRTRAPSSEDEESDLDVPSGQRAASQSTANTSQAKRKRRASSNEEERSEEEGIAPPTRRERSTKTTRAQPRRTRGRQAESSDEEFAGRDERGVAEASKGSSDEEIIGRRKSQRTEKASRVAAAMRRRSIPDVDSDEESDDQTLRTPPRPRSARTCSGRSQRVSAQKAMVQLAAFRDDQDEDVIPKSFRRKKKMNDDEEFKADEEEDDDEEDVLSEEESEEELVEDDSVENEDNVGIVKDDDIGSAEESNDEGDTTSAYHSPQLKVVEHTSPARLKKSPIFDTDEDSDDDRKMPAFSPQLVVCTSAYDAITTEPLPTKHVCFISPDGQSRQCFALETLRKVAQSAVSKSHRRDLAGRNVETFLQPPHFRSAMSDDLLDQIASRFGRDALDMNGDYYKRKEIEEATRRRDAREEDRLSLTALDDEFTKQIQKYVRTQMGSSDLYVCPLCYPVARQRFGLKKDMDDEMDPQETEQGVVEETTETMFEKYVEKGKDKYDPMEVLAHLDESLADEFLVASSFCFSKVSAVKEHLRDDHHVTTKGVEGNDLYNTFKIRTTDGLLQRHLKTKFGGFASQGDMQRYWFSGHNFDFVYLLNLVERATQHRCIVDDDEPEGGSGDEDKDRQEAEAFVQLARTYYASFDTHTKLLWELISGNYLKATAADINEFVVDDQEEEEEEEDEAPDQNSHRLLDAKREQEQERDSHEAIEALASRYENRNREYYDDDGLEDLETEEGRQNENEEIEILSSSEDEADKWVDSIMGQRKAKMKPKKSRQRTSRNSTSPQNDEKSMKDPPAPASARKRVIIQESEEE